MDKLNLSSLYGKSVRNADSGCKEIITLHEAQQPGEIYSAWLERISSLVRGKGAGWHCTWTTIDPNKVRYIAFFGKCGEDREIMVYS